MDKAAAYACGLTADGRVDCGRGDPSGDPSPKTAFVGISLAPGTARDCGARALGGIECWNGLDPIVVLAEKETFTQVAAGSADPWGTIGGDQGSVCGLKTNGEIVCWWEGFCSHEPPKGTFTQISMDHCHGCALDPAGEIVCWGDYTPYEDPSEGYPPLEVPPPGPYVQVDAGFFHDCAVRASGEVVCWWHPVYGNLYGESTPPEGTFVKVVAGLSITCGIKTDGSIECWGQEFESGEVPDGTFVDAAISGKGGCALNTAQEVVCWGDVFPPWYDE